MSTRAQWFAGSELRQRRLRLGQSQKAFAQSAGVSANHLCQIERGTKQPSPEMAAALARQAGCALDELVLSPAVA